MRRLYRTGALVGALLLLIGTILAIDIPAASAASGKQFCFNNGGWACLNSWGGGPWVNVYTGGPNGTQNNHFTIIKTGAYYGIEDTAGNAWNGKCIGDANNKSGDARTSLDPCGTGWGTNFVIVFGTGTDGCPAGTDAFYNNHWGGWLGPPDNWVNGSHFYLNKPFHGAVYCFQVHS
jgi:hypothetical protein